MIEVDARGLSCPLPVVRTKKALEELGEGELLVLIERPDGCENVVRFADSQGCSSVVEEKDGLYRITIRKGGETPSGSVPQAANGVTQSNTSSGGVAPVLLFTSARLGTGNDELGAILMKAFLNTLAEADPKPAKMLFLNEAVTLTTEGSEVTDTLRGLEQAGVRIFSCGTCLDYYKLKEKLLVGVVTNMYDTVDTLLTAEKVIRI